MKPFVQTTTVLVGLVLLLFAAAARAGSSPTISVSPSSGDVGASLTVTGTGWSPNGLVTVTIGGAQACQVPADSSGNLNSSPSDGCQVPSGLSPGSHPLSASDGTDTASGPSFTVTPVAAFSAPSSIDYKTALALDASQSQGSIRRYLWDFGDGTTASSASPTISHSYTAPAKYLVTLTVVDSSGNTDSASRDVMVEGPPTAAFNPTSAIVLAGSNVAFDGTPSSDPGGSIEHYGWSFGDNGSSTLAQPTHKYFSVGTFDVTLTVTDSSGRAASITHPITVIAPPPIQTLILTPVAPPTIVKWAHVAITHSGRIDLGERLFCPGPGPGCTAFILATGKSPPHPIPSTGIVAGSATARSVLARATITIAANGSAELTMKVSRQALASLRKHGHLPARVKVAVLRGGQTTTSTFSRTFRLA